jgi:glycosyltransferase involved in cell wall biosynthesis
MRITVAGPANVSEFAAHLTAARPFPQSMGGTPVNALVLGLLGLGHHVSLVTGSQGITDNWHSHGPNLNVTVVPFRKRARNRALDFFAAERRGLAEAIAASQPDIIHAHWTYEFALAAIDSKTAPVLVTAHDAPLAILRHTPDPYRLIRTVMAYQVRLKTQNLTAVSPYLAHRWKWQMGYLRPISVIPNPLPTLALSTSSRSSSPVVLGVGNDSRLKNFRVLLSAFSGHVPPSGVVSLLRAGQWFQLRRQ